MGRGRQKAKQTKVARALKYHTASIDVTALQHELSGGEQDYDDRHAGAREDVDADDDPYAAYVDGDDESDYASPSRGR